MITGSEYQPYSWGATPGIWYKYAEMVMQLPPLIHVIFPSLGGRQSYETIVPQDVLFTKIVIVGFTVSMLYGAVAI